jgi:hypothetical protein
MSFFTTDFRLNQLPPYAVAGYGRTPMKFALMHNTAFSKRCVTSRVGGDYVDETAWTASQTAADDPSGFSAAQCRTWPHFALPPFLF